MLTIEIEDNLVVKINEAARKVNKTPADFVQSSVRETLRKLQRDATDAEKVKRAIESYQKIPQKPEEYEIWEDEQVWGDE